MKILYVQKRILFPADAGGKVRTLNLLRHLARWHEVTYLCNLQPGEESWVPDMLALGLRLETTPWREVPRGSWRFYRDVGLNLLSPDPFTVCKDYDPALRCRAGELLASERFDLLVCDFVQMARNVLGLGGPATVLFQHNVEAQVYQRQAERGFGWLRRRYLAEQARKMRAFEAAAGRQFDAVIAVSDPDRRVFEREYGWRHVYLIDTGVDFDYYRPLEGQEQADRLVFVGSLDWLPNQDAVRYFVRSIWPAIRRVHPQARFQVVGRNPAAAINRLQRVPGVEVAGGVADVRPYLAGAAVVVVPLLAGSGTRLKVFEAMAMGKAVVSTSLGVEGLPVVAGEHLLLADAPASFSGAVNLLLGDAARRRQLGEAARRLVYPHYSAEHAARQFDRICRHTVERRGQPPVSPAAGPPVAGADPTLCQALRS